MLNGRIWIEVTLTDEQEVGPAVEEVFDLVGNMPLEHIEYVVGAGWDSRSTANDGHEGSAVLALHARTYRTASDETWGNNPICAEDSQPYPCATVRAVQSDRLGPQ